MARKGYHISNQAACHFLTFTVVNWIDVFTRSWYCDVIISHLKYYHQKQGMKIHAYVIMPNHIHLILSSSSKQYDLSSIVGNLKRSASKEILKLIKSEPESRKEWMLDLFSKKAQQHKRNTKLQFWTHNNHPIEVEEHDMLEGRLNYIHENPVRAGYVSNGEHWIYSSASNYCNQLSIMKIDAFEEFVRS